MAKIATFGNRSPESLLGGMGARLRDHRLARGWTQATLSERAGVALSTLKLLESKGHGSLQRLIRVAMTLGIDGEVREWFARPLAMESIEAVKLAERQRAPRRKRREAGDGTPR